MLKQGKKIKEFLNANTKLNEEHQDRVFVIFLYVLLIF